MKKLLTLFLVLILGVSLVGCSPSEASDADSNEEPAATEAAPTEDIKMGRSYTDAHGTKAFTDTVVAMQGDIIVGVSMDEYQFMPKDQITAGVPNSDIIEDGFAGNYADPENTVLGSKRVNSDYYSKNMAEKAGATVTYAGNIDAIEDYAIGKTIEELETFLNDNDDDAVIDAVSGATMVDTPGYLQAIVEAAKSAK